MGVKLLRVTCAYRAVMKIAIQMFTERKIILLWPQVEQLKIFVKVHF